MLCAFCKKKLTKIRQIWPWQLLKHFTVAYRGRGLPPCAQSQHPINRETGYSNVLGKYASTLRGKANHIVKINWITITTKILVVPVTMITIRFRNDYLRRSWKNKISIKINWITIKKKSYSCWPQWSQWSQWSPFTIMIIRFRDDYVRQSWNTTRGCGSRGGGFIFDTHSIHKVFNIVIIVIIIVTRPWPAFGRQGLGGSSGGYTSHG